MLASRISHFPSMSCLAVDTEADLTKYALLCPKGALKSKVNSVCVGSLVKYVLRFQVCPKEDEIRQATVCRGTQAECIISFKGTLTLRQLMKEMETRRQRLFQLVRVEAGGDSCQGDKSCEHEVWLLRHWFFSVFYLIFPPSLCNISQSFPLQRHRSCFSAQQPHHLPPSPRRRRWGPHLFSLSQDQHQSHSFTCDEWRKIFLTVTKDISLLFTASQQV